MNTKKNKNKITLSITGEIFGNTLVVPVDTTREQANEIFVCHTEINKVETPVGFYLRKDGK